MQQHPNANAGGAHELRTRCHQAIVCRGTDEADDPLPPRALDETTANPRRWPRIGAVKLVVRLCLGPEVTRHCLHRGHGGPHPVVQVRRRHNGGAGRRLCVGVRVPVPEACGNRSPGAMPHTGRASTATKGGISNGIARTLMWQPRTGHNRCGPRAESAGLHSQHAPPDVALAEDGHPIACALSCAWGRPPAEQPGCPLPAILWGQRR